MFPWFRQVDLSEGQWEGCGGFPSVPGFRRFRLRGLAEMHTERTPVSPAGDPRRLFPMDAILAGA